jgi:hypothetical protein
VALRAWGCNIFASSLSAIVFGVAPFVWHHHTQPEVFALNHVLAAGILLVCGPRLDCSPDWRWFTLPALAGLGLANHHSIILLAPIGLLGWSVAIRRSQSSWHWKITGSLIALVAGLSPYIYLYVVAIWSDTWHWGDPTSLRGFLDIFLRREYGTLSIGLQKMSVTVGEQIKFLLTEMSADLFYLYPVGAIVGAVAVFRGEFNLAPYEEWSVGLCLVATLSLTGPVFVSLFSFDPEAGIFYLYVRKMHLLFELMVVFVAGFGFHWLSEYFFSSATEVLLLALTLILGSMMAFSFHQRHRSKVVDQHIRDMYESAPEEAVILSTGDLNLWGKQFYLDALGKRDDIDFVDVALLSNRWYYQQKRQEVEFELPFEEGAVELGHLLDNALSTGRPVLLAPEFTKVEYYQPWPMRQWGLFVRMYPQGRIPPTSTETFYTNQTMFSQYRVQPVRYATPHSWKLQIMMRYAVPWYTLAESLMKERKDKLAVEAYRLGNRYRP